MNQPPNRFQVSFDQTLSGLEGDPWLAQRIMNNEKGARTMKKNVTLGIVLILILSLTSIVGIAMSQIIRSEPANARVVANEALEKQYGLDAFCLGAFIKETQQKGNTMIIDYLPVGYAPILLGSYQVTVTDGKAVDVSWSYDDTEVDFQNGDLTSPVWGAKQIKMALQNPEEGSAISAPLYEDLPETTPSQRPEGSIVYLDDFVYVATPTELDLTMEAASSLAIQTVAEEYDLPTTLLEQSIMDDPSFYTRDEENPIWVVRFFLTYEDVEMDMAVILDARTGEILLTDLAAGGNG